MFYITAWRGTFGGSNSLTVKNDPGGSVVVDSSGTAVVTGRYLTAGKTRIASGTFYINGSAEQTGGVTELVRSTSRLTVATGNAAPVFYIRDGQLIGKGTLNANLALGYTDATQPNANTSPVIEPGGIGEVGQLTVQGNLLYYSGKLRINIAGSADGQYDKLVVSGYVDFNQGGQGRVREALGDVLAKHAKIEKNKELTFLTYNTKAGNFSWAAVAPVAPSTFPWASDSNNSRYWFITPDQDIDAKLGKIEGKAFRDNGALAGAFEPGAEAVLAGRTVRLFDEAGTIELASTTTDADGTYLFDDLDAGTYVVAFDRPTGERFAPPDVGSDDERDSDADPLTGRVTVTLSDDQTDIDAGFYYNAAPIAVDDTYSAHKNTTVSGAVLPNDTDADGDDLTAALATGPSHGSVTLNPDGTFTYTPNADFTGTDTFTYTVDDGYDGTDTGLVTVTVSGTPAPVGTADSYSAPAELFVPAATGVLSNDTAPNGPLTAVLVSGPSHGTLELNPDGSFLYTPDDDFTGTDSFTYRPVDADGPGEPTTVQIVITDTPPEADDDTATTDEDAAVVVNVLGNDTALNTLGARDTPYALAA